MRACVLKLIYDLDCFENQIYPLFPLTFNCPSFVFAATNDLKYHVGRSGFNQMRCVCCWAPLFSFRFFSSPASYCACTSFLAARKALLRWRLRFFAIVLYDSSLAATRPSAARSGCVLLSLSRHPSLLSIDPSLFPSLGATLPAPLSSPPTGQKPIVKRR